MTFPTKSIKTFQYPFSSTTRLPDLLVANGHVRRKNYDEDDIDSLPEETMRRSDFLQVPEGQTGPKRSKSFQFQQDLSDVDDITVINEEIEDQSKQKLVYCQTCSTKHFNLCCEELEELANNDTTWSSDSGNKGSKIYFP